MNGPSPKTLQAQLCKCGRSGDTEHQGGRGACSTDRYRWHETKWLETARK